MRLVPFDRRKEVEQLLELYREKYDERLEFGAERLRDEIVERGMTHRVNAEELAEGKRYGCIGYSVGATAIRCEKQLPYHGEIYLYVWVWNGKEFVTQDAWGGVHSKWRLPEPIIELS